MDNLLVKAMSEEACSAYLCHIFALKLLIIFVMRLSPIFGIHDFVIVADLHLKIGKSLCIVQTPGSIHLHTQFTMNITTLYQFITRRIQS